MKREFLLICLATSFALGPHVSSAADPKETIGYKLAQLQIQSIEAEAFLNPNAEPPQEMVSEFQWIMEGLRNRCTNSETELAKTIIETWKYVTAQGFKFSVLDISRELSKTARNRVLFGEGKVDFRKTSGYWIKQFQIQAHIK